MNKDNQQKAWSWETRHQQVFDEEKTIMILKEEDLTSQKLLRPLHLFTNVKNVQVKITIGTRKTIIRILYKRAQFVQPYYTVGGKKLLDIIKD